MRRLLLSTGFLVVLLPAFYAAQQQTATPNSTARQNTAPKGSITGTVLGANSGSPLRKALVTLRPASAGQGAQAAFPGFGADNAGQRGQRGGGSKSIVTGEDGAFSFPDLDAGQYRISVERDGYISQDYGQRSWNGNGTTITLTAGQRIAGLTVQLLAAGTLAGRIRDEYGEPLAGVQVQALTYTYQQGTRTLTTARQAQTNDVGEYRLYWLTPGEYYVSASPGPDQLRVTTGVQGGRGGRGGPGGAPGGRGGATLLNPTEDSFAPTYYPGIIDPEAAAPVKMGPGVEIHGIDFILQTVPTVKVTGRVTSPEPISAAQLLNPAQDFGQRGQRGGGGQRGQRGQQPGLPGGAVQVLLSRVGPGASAGGRGGPGGGRGGGGRGGPDGGGPGQGGPAAVNPDGTFEISNVIPGAYTLTAIQQGETRTLSARTRIDVGNAGLDHVNVDLRYGVTLSGQIQVEGQSATQVRTNTMRVSLTPTQNLPFGNADAQIDEEGKFTLTNVGLMTYRINVNGLGGSNYLISARYGSVDPLNELLQISDEGTRLVLNIGTTPGQITGIATDKSGQPFAGATCVLIPSSRNRVDLYKATTSDQEGRISFANVAPGDYKMLAWEDVPSGAYMDPSFLKGFEDRSVGARVEKGGIQTIQLQVIPAGS